MILSDLVEKAFSTFSCKEIAPVARLKDGVTILELFHGKTWAFKDLALSCVGQFINYFCSRSKTHYTIVVGKSTSACTISFVKTHLFYIGISSYNLDPSRSILLPRFLISIH